MNKADIAIVQCADEALSASGIDKDAFYNVLLDKYGVKKEEIGEKFEGFHFALREVFGPKHFAIERQLIRTLKELTKNGTYQLFEEIEARARISEVLFSETETEQILSPAQVNMVDYARQMRELLEENRKKLLESERMAAIGQTAGMVGHDLRNPLQTIAGEVFLAKAELKQLPESEHKTNLQESIESIEQQMEYMDKIVSDLQAFVKPVQAQKQIVTLKPMTSSVLFQLDIPENVKTKLGIADSQSVKADPELLKRVLINLINNAVQAMPLGGDLTLTAYNDKLNDDVTIIVEDNGIGIPTKIQSKIFTPLFTTKPKGQGFGLAVCRRVIEAHGGSITFESQEGKGTKFTLRLPNY